MQFTKAAILAFIASTGAVAAPCDSCKFGNVDDTTSGITSRNLPSNLEWRNRIWSQMPHNWIKSKFDKINADHDLVTTPSLPAGIDFPSPLLPTDNSTVLDIYRVALAEYEKEQKKNKNEIAATFDQKRKDMAAFTRMNLCSHDIGYCDGLKEKAKLFFNRSKYLREYRELKKNLAEEQEIEWMADLGKELKELMELGEPISTGSLSS